MKNQILFLLVFSFSYSAYSQSFGASIHYARDFKSLNNYMEAHGAQFGLGFEDVYFGESDWMISSRVALTVFNNPDDFIRDSICFDLPSEYNHWGFAQIKNSKSSFLAQIDIGFDPWGYSVIHPYLSLGYELHFYDTQLRYDLYNKDSDLEINYKDIGLNNFSTNGFQSGIGFKVRPFFLSSTFLDFRFIYSGAWMSKKHQNGMMEMESFHIDSQGNESMSFQSNKYYSNFGFRVGVIIDLSSLKNNNDDDDYSTSSNESTEEECENNRYSPESNNSTSSGVTLKPKSSKEK